METNRKFAPLHVFLIGISILGQRPAFAAADVQCSEPTLQVDVRATAERNASGHWLLSAAASADVASRARPLLTTHARLHVADACAGGWAGIISTTAVRADIPNYERMTFKTGTKSLYRLHTHALPWEEAAAACRKDGAHLLVINSDAEALVVKEFFSRKPELVGAFNHYWFAVGFRRFLGRNETVLGGSLEHSGYNKWAPFDGQWVLSPITDCGAVDRRLLYALEDCKHARGFICELEM